MIIVRQLELYLLTKNITLHSCIKTETFNLNIKIRNVHPTILDIYVPHPSRDRLRHNPRVALKYSSWQIQ